MTKKISRKSLVFVTLLIGLIVLNWTTFAAPTDSTRLQAERDTFTDLNQPDTNFNDQMLLVESTMGPPGEADIHTRVLYLAFDLSGVAFEIKSAFLSLEALTCDRQLPLDAGTVDVYGIDNDPANAWTESTLTWNNQPLPTTSALISATVSSPGTLTWTDGAGGSFASWLESQRNANDGAATLLLKVDTTSSGGIQDVFFEDREGSGAGLGCNDASGPPLLALDSSYTAYQLFLPLVRR